MSKTSEIYLLSMTLPVCQEHYQMTWKSVITPVKMFSCFRKIANLSQKHEPANMSTGILISKVLD